MKWRILIIPVMVLLLLLTISVPVLAIDEPGAVSLHDIDAYRNLIEDGDVLFIVPYTIEYETTPDEAIDEAFIFQHLDSGGTDLIGTVLAFPCPLSDGGWGDGIVSFYYGASDNITWDENYIFRVVENPVAFEDPENWTYTITSSGYLDSEEQADNQEALYEKIINIAESLSIDWDVELYEQAGFLQSVLTSYGELYFNNAVKGLPQMCPQLYSLQIEEADLEERSWDYTLAETFESRYDGTFIGDFMTGFGGLTGAGQSATVNILSIILFTALVGLSIWKFKATTNAAFMDGSALMIYLTMNGMFSFVVAGLVTFLAALVTGIILFLNRS